MTMQVKFVLSYIHEGRLYSREAVLDDLPEVLYPDRFMLLANGACLLNVPLQIWNDGTAEDDD